VSGPATASELVFIGDVHLDRQDPALPEFLSFLEGLADRAARIVLMGDLFNVWIGGAGFEQPHQAAVVETLVSLRGRGVTLAYLEGNRDYRIARHYAGRAFDQVSDGSLVERFGGHRIHASHGDLVNVEDRQYRLWRRFSRSAPVWGLFGLLSRRRQFRLAESIERRMRSTNLAYKRQFPEAQVREYAARQFRAGSDLVVLGHFHVEKELAADPNDPLGGRVFVLPEWRESRRHLVVARDGSVGFVDS
jgi:UDP-2,3-diacylglucosamine hydrolase